MAQMDFHPLTSLDETLEKLAAYGSDATLVAGGTSARYLIMSGQVEAKAVLHIERLAEFAGITLNGGARLGALANMRDIAEDTAIIARFASLATAAGKCGGWQTQSIATIGGNVCGASPSADLIAPLLVQDAEIELHSQARGSRTVALTDFLVAAYKTDRAADEMATAFHLPAQPGESADTYIKIQRRSAMERPIIGVALRLALDESGENIREVRIAVCGAGPMPFRASEAETLLAGQAPTDEAVRAASDAIIKRSTFRDDARASASYRAAVLPRAFAHALSLCRATIAGA